MDRRIGSRERNGGGSLLEGDVKIEISLNASTGWNANYAQSEVEAAEKGDGTGRFSCNIWHVRFFSYFSPLTNLINSSIFPLSLSARLINYLKKRRNKRIHLKLLRDGEDFSQRNLRHRSEEDNDAYPLRIYFRKRRRKKGRKKKRKIEAKLEGV